MVRSRWLRWPGVSVLLVAVVLGIGCSDEQEHTPCGDGAYLMELPEMQGTHVYCRTNSGLAHGDYRFEDSKGSVLVAGQFAMGLPAGQWTWWHDGGQVIKQEGGFVEGLADGLWKGFDENGTLRWEHTFAAGVGCGAWTDYDDIGDVETQTDYAACDGAAGLEPPAGVELAPETVEGLWNGLTCFGPTSLNTSDTERWCATDMGKKQGPYIKYFPASFNDADGQVIQLFGSYEGGVREGTWTTFNQFREIVGQGDYADGAKSGTWTTWRSGGMPIEQGDYAAGQRTGTWRGFFGNGLPAWQGGYANGLKSGSWQTWWPDGQLAEEAEWQNDQLHGIYTGYHTNGAVDETGEYEDGRRQGEWEGFWENGNPHYEGTYVDDFRHGTWTWFDRAGELENSGEYVWQNPMGDWTMRIEDTATGLILVGTGNYDYGVRQGIWTFTWEAAGTLESELLYIDDLREGEWISYWPSGNVRIEGYYLAGVGQFDWTYYYDSGQVMAQATYQQGAFNGPYVSYHANGQKKSEGTYSMDKRILVWTFWDEEGNVTKTEEYDAWGNPK